MLYFINAKPNNLKVNFLYLPNLNSIITASFLTK